MPEFNPDEYLRGSTPTKPAFDPDAYLGQQSAPAPKPEEKGFIDSVSDFFTGDDRETRATKELPEIGSGTGLLHGEDKLKTAAIVPALLTATDPQEMGKILNSNFPHVGIQQDPEGNWLATNNNTGVKVVLNKPGVSQLDIMQGLGIASAFMPSGRVAGAGIKGTAKLAAATGLTSAAIEGTQALSGGDFDASQVALDTALVGAGDQLVKGGSKLIKALKGSSGAPSARAQKVIESSTKGEFSPGITQSVKEVKRQGFDDGVTNVIANANASDKRAMKRMIDNMERGDADALYKTKNRPADIAGDSLLKKVNFIKGNNAQAGKQLGRVAESLKGRAVDIDAPVSKFIDDLTSMGVKLDESAAPDFKGSMIEFSEPAKRLVSNTLIKLKRNPTPDAFEAHGFKKFLDEDLKHGKKQEGGVSGKVESVLGDLRRGVNDSIGSKHAAYKEANARYSDTVGALNSLQDAIGKKVDFFGPNSNKATGTALRGLMSNNKSRVQLMDAIDNIESVAEKYGGSFGDDITTQMLFADELGAMFGDGARTSLRGESKKAGIDSAIDISQMSVPGALAVGAKEGAKKLRGINKKNQIKAIKKLLDSK